MKLIFLDILKTFYFALGYGWLTMLRPFQVNNEGTQPYTYMYLFSPQTPPPHPVLYETDFKINRIEKLENVNGIVYVIETLLL